MPSEPRPAALFASEDAANFLVAGIPAAARAIADFADTADPSKPIPPLQIAVPGGWQPSPYCRAEAERLAPGVDWIATRTDQTNIANAKMLDIPELKKCGTAIITATGKAGDGIVSRHINRPVSRMLTRIALRWPGARPGHATSAVGLLGLAMFAALLSGGNCGLIAGAALFQLASIVDGVDGEMARATRRSSARGAMLDSVTDAVTNLGFFSGVSYNIYTGGDEQAGLAGAIACIIFALGTIILGFQSRRDGGNFNFDALKYRLRQHPSRFKQAIIWLAMRDFYAFAACVTILAGAARLLLYIFAASMTIWIAVIFWLLIIRGDRGKRSTGNPPATG